MRARGGRKAGTGVGTSEQDQGQGSAAPSFDSASAAKARFKALGLTDDDVAVLAMVLYDDLSYTEIGSRLGVTKQSVRDRVAKCQRLFARFHIPWPKPRYKRVEPPKMIYMDTAALDGVGGFGKFSTRMGSGNSRGGQRPER